MSKDLFDATRGQLQKWSKGDTITAVKLEEPNEQLRRMTRGIAPPKQSVRGRPQGAMPPRLAWMKIKGHKNDYLQCERTVVVRGRTTKTIKVDVAKPWLLRRTTFDKETVNGVAYLYSSNILRKATKGAISEFHTIIPVYDANDWILAASNVMYGTGVTTKRMDPITEKLRDMDLNWIDLNIDGRQWAQLWTPT